MKVFLVIAILFLLKQPGYSQKRDRQLVDSLLIEFAKADHDSTKIDLLVEIMAVHVNYKPEEGLTYENEALKIATRTKKEMNIARIKDKIGRLHWRIGNFEKAYKNHFAALNTYVKAGDKYAEGKVLISIGQDYLNDGKFDEARIYLNRALKVSKESGDKATTAYAYDKLIAFYEMQGNIVEQSKAVYEHLKIYEEIGDKKGIAHATALLASNFQALGNNEEALKYFKKSLTLTVEVEDKLQELYIYRYIADLYQSMGNLPEAKNYYLEGLRLANEMGDARIILADMHRGLGNVYRASAEYDEALHYFLIAADEFKSVNNNHPLASLYSEIGIVYTRLKKYDLAKKAFSDAMVLCKNLDSKVPMGDYYRGLQLLDSATGHWRDAYEHYKQYVVIRDSTFNRGTLKKLVVSQMQYEAEKKEAIEKAEQEKKDVRVQEEIKRQRNIRNSAFAGLGIVLLFSIVVYRQRNKIAREKKRSDQLVMDKETLIKEVHHRVKNNLEVVSSLLALQSAQIDDPNTKEAMLAGQNRVHSIGIVHQKLYQGETLGAIEMKDYFISLSESILDSFGAQGRVNIEFAMEKLNVDIDTAVPLGLIVNELLTNTLKYAFPDNQNGSVRIKLEKQPESILHLEVSDNGIGKSGVTQGTGFGGQLVSLLTRQLNGSMREEIKNGTRISFDFKLEKSSVMN